MKEAANGDGRAPIPGYNMFSSGCPIASGHRGGRLDDRFHETGLDEASIHGTGIMFVDSSFEKS
jgi:hypothetical protein